MRRRRRNRRARIARACWRTHPGHCTIPRPQSHNHTEHGTAAKMDAISANFLENPYRFGTPSLTPEPQFQIYFLTLQCTVAHLIADLGWVDLDFECSTICHHPLFCLGRGKFGRRDWAAGLPHTSQPNLGLRPDGPPRYSSNQSLVVIG